MRNVCRCNGACILAWTFHYYSPRREQDENKNALSDRIQVFLKLCRGEYSNVSDWLLNCDENAEFGQSEVNFTLWRDDPSHFAPHFLASDILATLMLSEPAKRVKRPQNSMRWNRALAHLMLCISILDVSLAILTPREQMWTLHIKSKHFACFLPRK